MRRAAARKEGTFDAHSVLFSWHPTARMMGSLCLALTIDACRKLGDTPAAAGRDGAVQGSARYGHGSRQGCRGEWVGRGWAGGRVREIGLGVGGAGVLAQPCFALAGVRRPLQRGPKDLDLSVVGTSTA